MSRFPTTPYCNDGSFYHKNSKFTLSTAVTHHSGFVFFPRFQSIRFFVFIKNINKNKNDLEEIETISA